MLARFKCVRIPASGSYEWQIAIVICACEIELFHVRIVCEWHTNSMRTKRMRSIRMDTKAPCSSFISALKQLDDLAEKILNTSFIRFVMVHSIDSIWSHQIEKIGSLIFSWFSEYIDWITHFVQSAYKSMTKTSEVDLNCMYNSRIVCPVPTLTENAI